MLKTRRIWLAALCVAAVLLPTIAFSTDTAAAQAPQTNFTLFGEDGDLISAGDDVLYTESADVSLYATAVGEAVYITVIATEIWFVDLTAPDGKPLKVGDVVGATLFPLQAAGDGGMHVYGAGRDCVDVDARFVVRELRRDVLGGIDSLAIDFTQSCNGGPSALGGVRINSTYTAAPTSPDVAQESAQTIPGDVNCDNVVNVTDAMAVAQFAVGNRVASSTCPLANAQSQIYVPNADLNADGVVTVTDAMIVAQCSVFIPNDYCD